MNLKAIGAVRREISIADRLWLVQHLHPRQASKTEWGGGLLVISGGATRGLETESRSGQ
jgi:hypothetical protein